MLGGAATGQALVVQNRRGCSIWIQVLSFQEPQDPREKKKKKKQPKAPGTHSCCCCLGFEEEAFSTEPTMANACCWVPSLPHTAPPALITSKTRQLAPPRAAPLQLGGPGKQPSHGLSPLPALPTSRPWRCAAPSPPHRAWPEKPPLATSASCPSPASSTLRRASSRSTTTHGTSRRAGRAAAASTQQPWWSSRSRWTTCTTQV